MPNRKEPNYIVGNYFKYNKDLKYSVGNNEDNLYLNYFKGEIFFAFKGYECETIKHESGAEYLSSFDEYRKEDINDKKLPLSDGTLFIPLSDRECFNDGRKVSWSAHYKSAVKKVETKNPDLYAYADKMALENQDKLYSLLVI